MSESRHTEDYPLKPTDADLDDESLDAQEPAGRPEGSGRAPDQAETGASPDEPAPPMIRGWTPADDASISALRFNLREWQDRARDMERERDAADLALVFLNEDAEARAALARHQPADYPLTVCACVGPLPICMCARRWLEACLANWNKSEER